MGGENPSEMPVVKNFGFLKVFQFFAVAKDLNCMITSFQVMLLVSKVHSNGSPRFLSFVLLERAWRKRQHTNVVSALGPFVERLVCHLLC